MAGKISFVKFLFILFFAVILNSISAQIYVNQAGYLSDKIKLVYFSNAADSFFVHDNHDDSVVYKNKTSLWKSNDPSTKLTIYRGDFSDLTKNGNYYITDNLSSKSWSFEISDTVFNSVLKKSLKGFYFQRCGTQLLSANAGVYEHPACHINDGTFHSTSGGSGKIDETGGWHDAGDYGKYVVNAGITVGTLLMAYEFFPEKFDYDDSNIPESGNGVPDILDEVGFELDWLFKMQRDDGGVYFKLTRTQFAGFVMPQSDNATRYIYQVSSTATADFAAIMARAYRNYLSFDETYANKCLDAAKKAWKFLEANPQIVPAGGFRNPSDTATGGYGDGNDSDERLWAAAELFISTGETNYQFYYETNYNSQVFTSEMSWPNLRSMANLTYLFSKAAFINSTIQNQLKQSLINYCNNLVSQKINTDGFNVAISSSEYYWGSNGNVLNRAVLLIAGYEQSGNQGFYDAALFQLNYIIGANANNISFVTGVGQKHTMNPHHRPSQSDKITEPVPGLMAGGPNSQLQDNILKSMFDSSTPAALCYADNWESYASNENAINWNAPLVFVSGYFSNIVNHTSSESMGMNIPQNFLLEQNYPNPFNPTTIIDYEISSNDYVNLKVFDILGREVTTLVDDYQYAGIYHSTFSALDSEFTSGIYFYQLKVGKFSQTKKMILLR